MKCRSCGSPSVQVGIDVENNIPLQRCGTCGLRFHEGFLDEKEVREYYAAYYHPANLEFSAVTETRYRALAREFEPFRVSGRILDVGCGSGHLLAVMQQDGWTAFGTEIAAVPLPELSARGISCFHGELRDASYAEDWFDVIHCSETIEHVLKPAALVEEIHRVLRPGGLVYLTTPNYNSVSRRLLGTRWRPLCREHVSYFTPAALSFMLTRARFDRLDITTRNIDPLELRKLWRRSAATTPGFQKAATDTLRSRIDRRAILRGAKHVVNRVLSATGSGETIIARAVKPEGARAPR